jgi:hypothetical protein
MIAQVESGSAGKMMANVFKFNDVAFNWRFSKRDHRAINSCLTSRQQNLYKPDNGHQGFHAKPIQLSTNSICTAQLVRENVSCLNYLNKRRSELILLHYNPHTAQQFNAPLTALAQINSLDN